MEVFGLKKALNQLVVNSVSLHEHVVRIDDCYVLRRMMDFKAQDHCKD